VNDMSDVCFLAHAVSRGLSQVSGLGRTHVDRSIGSCDHRVWCGLDPSEIKIGANSERLTFWY
jgi:hypothetical protein